ncbi:hypothetical protein CLU79DRAFT_514073 [Phycomyces nitens]|nr:hypothetical protein CLU79DRAFT_514073 [Phycomyces nitens]
MSQLYYPPAAPTPGQLHLNTFLCNITDTIINDKQGPYKKSEIGFTIDNVSPLFKYLFPTNGVLSYKWEKSSMLPRGTASKGIRMDFIILASGQEIGCGEIKPMGTTPQLINEDRARTVETLKRQIHGRILKSKNQKEFMTFGLIFNGFDIELYLMVFEIEGTEHYQFYKVDTLKLPSSPETYTSVEETVENLLIFKTLIMSSLAEEADILKPYIYHDYIHLFQPTLIHK